MPVRNRETIMQIRLMTIEDYEAVHALWMTIKGFAIRSIDDSEEGVERFLARNPDTSTVAEVDGKIVGAILCGHDGRRGCLYHVCVHPDYRRRGIGDAFFDRLDAWARENGVVRLELTVECANTAAVALYEKHGFAVEGRREKSMKVNGELVDEYYMAKILY